MATKSSDYKVMDLEWYFTHSLMKEFCAINNISRRQDHHIGSWGGKHYSDIDSISGNEWLAQNHYGIHRNDDIVFKWVRNASGRGASSYPVNILGARVSYVHGGFGLLESDKFKIKKQLFVLLASRHPEYTNGHRVSFGLFEDGTIKELHIHKLPEVSLDPDGNPNFKGDFYYANGVDIPPHLASHVARDYEDGNEKPKE